MRGCHCQKFNLKRRLSDSTVCITIEFCLHILLKESFLFRVQLRIAIDSSSYHFRLTFGTEKAGVCWQDLSQKIDDAIKSISDECYLQLGGFGTSGFRNFEGKVPEIRCFGKFYLSLKNQETIQTEEWEKTGAKSGSGSLRVSERSSISRLKCRGPKLEFNGCM